MQMMKLNNILWLTTLVMCFNSCANTDNKKTAFVDQLVSQMTLDEKVGQMTQVDKRMLDSEEDIATYFLGSILSGGGSVPDDNTTKGWVNMVNRYQTQALSTRLKIPLIYLSLIHI